MNLLDNIRLNRKYRELKELNIDENLLKQIIGNRNFYQVYKNNKEIVIDFLKKFGTQGFQSPDINYNFDIIINNYQVFNDENFMQLFSILKNDIFKDNILKIINAGYSDKLLQFLKNENLSSKVSVEMLMSEFFSGPAFEILNANETIAGKSLLEQFYDSQLYKLIDLMNNGLYDGFKCIYEQIPEMQNRLNNLLMNSIPNNFTNLFSMELINAIGIDNLKLLLMSSDFQKDSEKIFEIIAAKNYQLLVDIINFRSNDKEFSIDFQNIKNVNGRLIENFQFTTSEDEALKQDCKSVFLNNYLGVKRSELDELKKFLHSINLVSELPEEFKNNYGELYQLLTSLETMSNDEIIELSKSFSSEKRDEYANLIKKYKNEGNKVLKINFSTDLKERNRKTLETIPHSPMELTTTSNEKVNIDVYEFTGQPFTMLIHAISDNEMSEHNDLVEKIIEDPATFMNAEESNNHISTSVITDDYMITYGNPRVIYGFDQITPEMLKLTHNDDAGIPRRLSESYSVSESDLLFGSRDNLITTIDDLMESTIKKNKSKTSMKSYNEVLILRKNPETGKKLRPSYIVCKDFINPNSVDAANYYNVPIYLIQKKYYSKFATSIWNEKESSIVPWSKDSLDFFKEIGYSFVHSDELETSHKENVEEQLSGEVISQIDNLSYEELLKYREALGLESISDELELKVK